MGDFTSIYKALLHDLNDPEKRGRARLMVPAVMGRNVTGWALPVLGGSASSASAMVGDQVWAFFENGDLNRPTWVPTAVGSPDAVVRVVHDGVSWPARPNVKYVNWIGPGPTAPPEAIANDDWDNTTA